MTTMNGTTSRQAQTPPALRPLVRSVRSPQPNSHKGAMTGRTHDTLSDNIRTQSIELLNRYLAASIDLRAQVKHAHWNTRGAAFIAVHELFDKVAAATDVYCDAIAERASAQGGTAHGTVQVAAGRSFLVPCAVGVADEKLPIEAISGAPASFGDYTRKAVEEAASRGDPGTAHLFAEVSRGIDHQLWLVESHSNPEPASRANGFG
jgi:starvation-inducible DNA-binding protein